MISELGAFLFVLLICSLVLNLVQVDRYFALKRKFPFGVMKELETTKATAFRYRMERDKLRENLDKNQDFTWKTAVQNQELKDLLRQSLRANAKHTKGICK